MSRWVKEKEWSTSHVNMDGGTHFNDNLQRSGSGMSVCAQFVLPDNNFLIWQIGLRVRGLGHRPL